MRRGMLVPPAVGLLGACVFLVCCFLVAMTQGSVAGLWLRQNAIPISLAFPNGPRHEGVVTLDDDGFRVIRGELDAGDGEFVVKVKDRKESLPVGDLVYTVKSWEMWYPEGWWGGTREVREQFINVDEYRWFPGDDGHSAMKALGKPPESAAAIQRVRAAFADTIAMTSDGRARPVAHSRTTRLRWQGYAVNVVSLAALALFIGACVPLKWVRKGVNK